jgi:hypothetical protein
MIKQALYIIILLSSAACKNRHIEKPVLLNKETLVAVPGNAFLFRSKEDNWQAVLATFTQPVPLQIDYTDEGFALRLHHKFGITEGPAHIILSKNNRRFFYRVNLLNASFGSITDREYRSPKTINPDSGIASQKINHTIDSWRNLIFTEQSADYFKEELISLSPVAGTFRAQKEKPITAFYVQPGSAIHISLNALYDKEDNSFEVTAGPLKDKHGNIVANGTTVAFIYTDGQKHYRMEAALQNGMAKVKIPARAKTYNVYAKVNETISLTIQLTAN